MTKLNKITDFAMAFIRMLYCKSDNTILISVLSKKSGLKLYTVQKMLKIILYKSNLFIAQRGVLSRYTLKKKSPEIFEIIKVYEGAITLSVCVGNIKNLCQTSNICSSGGKWNKAHHNIIKTLNDISLNDLLNCGNPSTTEGKMDIAASTIN